MKILPEKKRNSGNGVIGLLIFLGVIWGFSSLFSDEESYAPSSSYSGSVNSYGDYDDYEYDDYGYSEPENPYDDGSGHSAGYEWAEENDVDSCGGNSNSFIEGCEEYLEQRDAEEYYYDEEYEEGYDYY